MICVRKAFMFGPSRRTDTSLETASPEVGFAEERIDNEEGRGPFRDVAWKPWDGSDLLACLDFSCPASRS